MALAASDIGILVSTSEGFSNSILEYMASGLPVVATDLSSNREALGDDPQQPFCAIGDPSSIAARIQAFINDTDLRQKLGMRNRKRAAAEFSIDAMCENTIGIIDGLLHTVPSAPRKLF